MLMNSLKKSKKKQSQYPQALLHRTAAEPTAATLWAAAAVRCLVELALVGREPRHGQVLLRVLHHVAGDVRVVEHRAAVLELRGGRAAAGGVIEGETERYRY